MSKGHLFVISGCSGVGKSTVLKEVMASRDDLRFSVSATTRDKRPGEVDGVHYHFISREEFLRRVAAGEFVEYDEHNATLYGTLYSEVTNQLESCNVVLDIEPVGAFHVREKYGKRASLLFIAPPSLEDLEKRLRGRGDTSEEQIVLRMERSAWELEQSKKYDYVVVNDRVETCVEAVRKIIANIADEMEN